MTSSCGVCRAEIDQRPKGRPRLYCSDECRAESYKRRGFVASLKAKRPTKNVGPGCPDCGSVNSYSVERGWSEPDDHFLRRRRCNECAGTFVTAEVLVPTDETSFYRLDYRGREWRRENYRRQHAKTAKRLRPRPADKLFVNVRVKPATIKDTCLRGHLFTEQNTYRYPSTGARSCVTCRRERQREYHAERRAAA